MDEFDEAMRRLCAINLELHEALKMERSPERTAILQRIAKDAPMGSLAKLQAAEQLNRDELLGSQPDSV